MTHNEQTTISATKDECQKEMSPLPELKLGPTGSCSVGWSLSECDSFSGITLSSLSRSYHSHSFKYCILQLKQEAPEAGSWKPNP